MDPPPLVSHTSVWFCPALSTLPLLTTLTVRVGICVVASAVIVVVVLTVIVDNAVVDGVVVGSIVGVGGNV